MVPVSWFWRLWEGPTHGPATATVTVVASGVHSPHSPCLSHRPRRGTVAWLTSRVPPTEADLGLLDPRGAQRSPGRAGRVGRVGCRDTRPETGVAGGVPGSMWPVPGRPPSAPQPGRHLPDIVGRPPFCHLWALLVLLDLRLSEDRDPPAAPGPRVRAGAGSACSLAVRVTKAAP